MRLAVFNVTSRGIFVSTVQSMSVPIANNMPLVMPNIVVLKATVLFAAALATSLMSVQTDFAPFATTQDMLLQTVHSLRTPATVSSLTMETHKDCNLVPAVQVFEGGIVTV